MNDSTTSAKLIRYSEQLIWSMKKPAVQKPVPMRSWSPARPKTKTWNAPILVQRTSANVKRSTDFSRTRGSWTPSVQCGGCKIATSSRRFRCRFNSLKQKNKCAIGSINSHYFHIGDGHQPNSRGLYTLYKNSPLNVGWPSPIQGVDRPWLKWCTGWKCF